MRPVISQRIHFGGGFRKNRHGAMNSAWIPPKNFIRSAYKAKVPIVAICFGHQILAPSTWRQSRKI